jgi:hypothetical protein
LVVGLASGCSGAQGASGSGASPSRSAAPPPPTASPTPSATLDDAARARVPQAARAHTAKGAEAFARFYLEQVNKAWMTPDPELIRPYALESCKTCANYVHTAEWLKAQRLMFDGVPARLGPSAALPGSVKDAVLIQVSQLQRPAKILRTDGSVERALTKEGSLLDVRLLWHSGGWAVGSIQGEQA